MDYRKVEFGPGYIIPWNEKTNKEKRKMKELTKHIRLMHINPNMMNTQKDIRLTSFYERIEGNHLINHGAETQLTGQDHEQSVLSIMMDEFTCLPIESSHIFRKFISKNSDIPWKAGKGENCLRSICPPSIQVKHNTLNLIQNHNYILAHPSGKQDYPDIVMMRLSGDNLYLSYIECKGEKPKFNNNPPKKNENCIYVCGKSIYSGHLLTSDALQAKYRQWRSLQIKLAKEYTDEELIITPYRVAELGGWIPGKGTKYFRDHISMNIPLITSNLQRYLTAEQPVQLEAVVQHFQSE